MGQVLYYIGNKNNGLTKSTSLQSHIFITYEGVLKSSLLNQEVNIWQIDLTV